MSKHVTAPELARVATVAQEIVRTRVDRTFELPTGLYAMTVGLYLAFFAMMSVAFMNPELAIPMVVIAAFVFFGFRVAGKWASMKPDSDSEPLTWSQFRNRGIMTMSGKLTAGQAAAQVLILPALILVWGIAVAIIAAAVR
jgi:hypothetical protein